MARRLIVIPVIHHAVEMGSARESVEAATRDALGEEGMRRHQEDVCTFWAELERALGERLRGIDASKIRIYYDGVPAGGALGLRCVEEPAKAGSPGHRIALGLIGRGAALERTEDPSLLIEERGHVMAMIDPNRSAAEREAAALAYRARKGTLLDERDAYIAERIGATLREGELGLLFVGAAHDAARFLPADVEVEGLA